MLRALAGGALIIRGIAASTAEAATGALVLQIVGAAAGILVLGGLWTPVAGVMAGMVEAWIAVTQPGTQPLSIVLAGLGIGLAMIGPGTWSIDAQLYGRKQILPPES